MPHRDGRSTTPVVGLSSTCWKPRLCHAAGWYRRLHTRARDGACGARYRLFGASVRRCASDAPGPTPRGMRCFPLPLTVPRGRSVGHCARRSRSLERSKAKIDVYHATDHMVPRLAHTPVVATMHDAIPIAHPEWANPRLRRLKNWMLRDWVQSADAVIAISHAAIPELIDHYRIPRSRIRVVPLGVSASWFERPDDAGIAQTLAKHALTRGYFLNVGTLQPRKNIGALIDAYERLPLVDPLASPVGPRRQIWLGAEALRVRLDSLRSGGPRRVARLCHA